MEKIKNEKNEKGNISFEFAKIMDVHKIVYMWMKMKEEFSDPIYSILDKDHREAELFYLSLVNKISSKESQNSNIIILALYKKEPIGFGIGDIRILENSSHWIGYCNEIYVKDKFRNRGIEGSIRFKIIEELKKRKVSKVLYIVDYIDSKNIQDYINKGFNPVRIIFIKEEK